MHVVEVPTQQELAEMLLHVRSAPEEVPELLEFKRREMEVPISAAGCHTSVPLLAGAKALSVHAVNYSVYCRGGYTLHATYHSLRESHGWLSFLMAPSTKDYL